MGQEGYPWWRACRRAWYVWRDGKQIRLSADKSEAFRLWHELQLTEHQGELTIAALVGRYLEWAAKQFKPATVKTKHVHLERLGREWGDKVAEQFDGEAWLDRHGTWGRSTRWLVALTLKAMFAWAQREHVLATNPLRGWTVPGPRSRNTNNAASEADLLRLIQSLPGGYREAVLFLYLTGCRPGEMLKTERENVHEDAGTVILHQHKTDGTNRPRIIYLDSEALILVQRQMQAFPSGPLFRNTRGAPIHLNNIGNVMKGICKRLGLPHITPYSLRHFFATEALAREVPDAVVAALLGHTSTTILHKHYNHVGERSRVLHEALGKVRGKEVADE